MALQPGRYIGHFLGLASDGKPIYAVYCCVPETQSDSDLPSFVSVSDSTSDSGSWSSHPPSSYPDSGGSAPGGGGGIPCTECLSRLCVVRDDSGRIVDIYYYTDSGDYVRVPDCGYYGSVPSSSDSSGGSSGGGGGGGGCCPQDNAEYVVEYDFTVFGQRYVGAFGPLYWTNGSLPFGGTIYNPPCNPGPPTRYLILNAALGCVNGVYNLSIGFGCQPNICTTAPNDYDVSVTGCPGNPTIVFTLRPGRCASGSFVVRPA